MNEVYKFEFESMELSKDGSMDELLVLDRYAIPSYEGYKENDDVVAIVDDKDSKRVGSVVTLLENNKIKIKDRFGDYHEVDLGLVQKPLETKPSQLWTRWAKGGASVEKTNEQQAYWENEFRWNADGYRYSLGGRIQLMLGQEFVTGKKANLTAYNCYVSESPVTHTEALAQFLAVLDTAEKQALIHRTGGGDGINISTINTVEGSGAKPDNFIFYLSKNHPDYQELIDRAKLGKLKGVTIVTNLVDFNGMIKEKNAHLINAVDSLLNGLFDNIREMVTQSYGGRTIAIDFTGLRERNAIVKSVNGRSSGAESWMELFILVANTLQLEQIDCVDFAEIFSFIVNLIQQGGSRRGALMIILHVRNKSVLKFITRKQEMGHLQGANISVGIDDSFMVHVKLAKKLKKEGQLDKKAELKQELEIWETLVQSAWSSAEPGIVWLERYNKESNSWYFSPLICTNPCNLYNCMAS